jgi:hypothetical protein
MGSRRRVEGLVGTLPTVHCRNSGFEGWAGERCLCYFFMIRDACVCVSVCVCVCLCGGGVLAKQTLEQGLKMFPEDSGLLQQARDVGLVTVTFGL